MKESLTLKENIMQKKYYGIVYRAGSNWNELSQEYNVKKNAALIQYIKRIL
jgi:hypothetical protein